MLMPTSSSDLRASVVVWLARMGLLEPHLPVARLRGGSSIVSFTSSIPQNHIGSCFGVCIYVYIIYIYEIHISVYM